MRRKFTILLLLSIIILSTGFSLSLEQGVSNFNEYVDKYNNGELTAGELIVYLDYFYEKMYLSLEESNLKGFTETSVEDAFGGTSSNDLIKEYKTNDFIIVLEASILYNDYIYENTGMDVDMYYTINFYLENVELTTSKTEISENLQSFINELEQASDSDDPDYETLTETFSELNYQIIQLEGDCSEVVQGLMQEEEGNSWDDSTNYKIIIDSSNRTNCWQDENCSQVCEPVENCWDSCEWEEDCEPTENCWEECHQECEEEEVCELNENTNETECEYETVCSEVCETVCEESENCEGQEVCSEVCETNEECHMQCEQVEVCQNETDGELKLYLNSGEDYSNLRIQAWGEDFEPYNQLNEGNHERFSSQSEIESFVKMRQALQESINNEFAEWYFEEFIGNEPSKIVHAGSGLRRVLDNVIYTEERIADALMRSEDSEWPDGFEEINVDYETNTTSLEVWEKWIPVERMNNKMLWTTLYTYSFHPSKSMMKSMIEYKIGETSNIGIGVEEVNELKSDPGKMELIKRIANEYDGSLDVKLSLNDDEEVIFEKYVNINVNDTIKFSDNETNELDIIINVEYEPLYEFVSYASSKQSDEIRAPYWVESRSKSEEDGFSKFLSVIGAVLRFWRTGVSIQPPQALLKLLLNVFDVINFLTELNNLNQASSVNLTTSS